MRWDSLALTSGSLLLHSAEGAGLEDGGRSDLDVLLRRDSDHERGDVHELLADGDVSLSDHHSGMMDRVGDLLLGHEGLKSSLHELVDGQSKNVIELSLVLLEEAELDDSPDESISLEGSSGVVLVEGKKSSGGLSELGEGELDSPHFSLVSESVCSDDSQLVHESVSIEGFPWSLRSFPIICVSLWHVGFSYVHSTQ